MRRRSRFLPAWSLPLALALGLAVLAARALPLRWLAPVLGRAAGTAPWVPLLAPAQEARARQVGRAVQRVARRLPFTAACLPQALAARWLLGLYRVPCTLSLGLARTPAGLVAHAWVSAGRVRVTGGEGFGRFAVVGSFVAGA
ncbi:MAG: lasso peptide biosynthesis B2 protein [Rubrivivax sp.]